MSGFKGAFKCHKYMGENGKPCDCPLWHTIVETNIATGAERVTSDCLYRLLPKYLTEVIAASNRPAAAVESFRNEVASGFTKLAASLPRVLENGRALPGNKSESG